MKNKSIFFSLLIAALLILFAKNFSSHILAQSYSSLFNNPQTTTTTTTTTQTTGTSFTPVYANSRWSEDTMRSYFGQYNISVGNGATVYGLGNFAVTGIISLKKTTDYYNAVVRGSNTPANIVVVRATETYGIDKPVLDVQTDAVLDNFITTLATNRGNTSSGNLYQLGDDYFFQQSGYWHIIFGPSNGAFVKNTIAFFGIVRDNFNVQHPTLTNTNVPSSVNFYRTLSLGSSGSDVRDLQKLLNTDPYTQVAPSGAGSPGNESTYFGARTQAAVKAYQYKNNEILDAAGITTPSGIVASFSRAHLTAYWNYLNTNLRGTGHSPVLQYPTPTKPLQDIPLNGTYPATTVSATSTITITPTTTPIAVITTPNAPTYSGSYGDLPVQGNPNDSLNNLPVFQQPPVVNGSNVTDPNNSANQSSAQQPSLLQSLLPTILQTATRFLTGSTGGLGGPSALPEFGGHTLYNSVYDNSPYK